MRSRRLPGPPSPRRHRTSTRLGTLLGRVRGHRGGLLRTIVGARPLVPSDPGLPQPYARRRRAPLRRGASPSCAWRRAPSATELVLGELWRRGTGALAFARAGAQALASPLRSLSAGWERAGGVLEALAPGSVPA